MRHAPLAGLSPLRARAARRRHRMRLLRAPSRTSLVLMSTANDQAPPPPPPTVTITRMRNEGDGRQSPPSRIIVTCVARTPDSPGGRRIRDRGQNWPLGCPVSRFNVTVGEIRSIVDESLLDRPEKARTFSRTHAPSFFAGCVANLPTHHPLPSFRRLWAPRDLKSAWGWHARVRSSGAGALRIRPRHGVRRGVTQAGRRAGVEKTLILG